MNELTDSEQIIESISKFAGMIREYYAALIERGFDENEALVLTIEYQKEIISLAKQNNNQTRTRRKKE